MFENKKLWENVLNDIEMNTSKANFSTWFKNTYVIKEEEGVVFLGVPNEFVKDWLMNKYHKLILRSLRELSEGVRGVEYVVAKEGGDEEKKASPILHQRSGELPLSDHYIDKRDNLNPRYTFESFVIGGFNELAHAASQAVVKNPGVVYNPFFIHGGTGLGKTHLIQAVGNFLKMKSPETKIHYVTSEKFSQDLVNSIQGNKVNGFKERYRNFDVFIMDDIQFLSNKEKTQEELFHLFNVLYENNKQIVFSSDQHPNFIPGLEDRLKSRFGAGMIVDVSQPDYESRSAILQRKMEQRGINPSDQVVEYLASSLEVNIRELEGILNTVICQMEICGRDLTVEELKSLIKNNTRQKSSSSVKDVIKTVAGFYNIEEKDIYEKTRRKEVVKPRQVVMYLLREDFSTSYPTIGQKLGGRDHTTVMHSCEKMKRELKTDHGLAQEIEQLRGIL